MAKIFYNKLVRDKTQEIIEGKGETCEVRTIETEEEFQQELLKKVVEEATALSMARTREEFLEDVTDLMVVLDTLNERLQFDEKTMQDAMAENIERKGMFKNRHFLHWSDDKTYESNESPQGINS